MCVQKYSGVIAHFNHNYLKEGSPIFLSLCEFSGFCLYCSSLSIALEKLMAEGLRMPGAMCGLWGICGAITSIGAVLSIIDGTGPLSTDGTWGMHMQFTSNAIGELGTINGPRCCKRDAMIAFKNGIEYVNSHYDVKLEYEHMKCEYSNINELCIEERCPYYS